MTADPYLRNVCISLPKHKRLKSKAPIDKTHGGAPAGAAQRGNSVAETSQHRMVSNSRDISFRR